MRVIKEITEWACDFEVPNHIYVLNAAGKLKAYQKCNTGEWTVFNKPMMFDQRYRKFVAVTVDLPAGCAEELPAGAREVKGSNGTTYIVHNGKCTCSGFKFRGKCKHLS